MRLIVQKGCKVFMRFKTFCQFACHQSIKKKLLQICNIQWSIKFCTCVEFHFDLHIFSTYPLVQANFISSDIILFLNFKVYRHN